MATSEPTPRTFFKRYPPAGTPPGALIDRPRHSRPPRPPRIRVSDYSAEHLEERELASVDECRAFLGNGRTTWVDIQGEIDAGLLEGLGEVFGTHALALEDVLNRGQRPKAESYDQQLFVIASLPVLDNGDLRLEQVSLFLGAGFLITLHEGEEDPFAAVRKRLRAGRTRLRAQGNDYLLYALLDEIVDRGFPLLEGLAEQVEELEDDVLDNTDRETANRIHRLKRQLLLLRRNLWPQREMVSTLLREESGLIRSETRLFLRDCHDHTVQIMDLIENYHELAASVLDLYLTNVSNRMNEVMRLLTVIATIFIPLTFIAGIYGMNFSGENNPWAMPELHMRYGYPVTLLVMLGLAVAMLILFRRRRWI